MARDIRNVFISHIHEDDDGLPRLKDLVSKLRNDLPGRLNHHRQIQQCQQ